MRFIAIAFLALTASAIANGPDFSTTSPGGDPYFSARWFRVYQAPLSTAVKDSLPFDGYDPNKTNIYWPHAAVVAAVYGGTVTAIHIYQQNAWWSENRTSFHFQDDPDYALNVDKAGHFFGGAFASWVGQKGMQWSGFSETTSVWGGFALGSLFELYVEFEDGFAKDWGFSPGDAYADVLGAAWPVAQHYFEPLQHIQPKYSYFPSADYIEGRHHGNAFDDYQGQTYWVGIHVNGLLPESIEGYWPDWLAIAAGIAVRDYKDENGRRLDDQIHQKVILALDYDFTKIIPGDSWLLRALKEGLNFIHFPAPAIQISPGFIAYGLYIY